MKTKYDIKWWGRATEGPKEVCRAEQGEGTIVEESVRLRGPLNLTTRAEINRSYGSTNPGSVGVLFVSIRRFHGIHGRESTIATRQLPSTPDVERTDSSGDDSVACQRTPVGDSLNNE